MSSILDALRELEASRAPGAPAPDDPPRPVAHTGLLVAAVVASLVGASVAALLVRGALVTDVPTDEVTAIEAPAPPVAPEADGVPPPAAAVEMPASLATAEPPRARIVARGAAGRVASTTPFAAVQPPRRRGSRGTPAADEGAAPAAEQAVRPGEPRVHLMELHYTDDPASRRVTLGIAGTEPVTLGEGETAENVEVSLILPDRAYLRHAGNIFAVRPGR